jgi:hypothetical protein
MMELRFTRFLFIAYLLVALIGTVFSAALPNLEDLDFCSIGVDPANKNKLNLSYHVTGADADELKTAAFMLDQLSIMAFVDKLTNLSIDANDVPYTTTQAVPPLNIRIVVLGVTLEVKAIADENKFTMKVTGAKTEPTVGPGGPAVPVAVTLEGANDNSLSLKDATNTVLVNLKPLSPAHIAYYTSPDAIFVGSNLTAAGTNNGAGVAIQNRVIYYTNRTYYKVCLSVGNKAKNASILLHGSVPPQSTLSKIGGSARKYAMPPLGLVLIWWLISVPAAAHTLNAVDQEAYEEGYINTSLPLKNVIFALGPSIPAREDDDYNNNYYLEDDTTYDDKFDDDNDDKYDDEPEIPSPHRDGGHPYDGDIDDNYIDGPEPDNETRDGSASAAVVCVALILPWLI